MTSQVNRGRDDDAFPVVVVGAGLAGLTAALHLAARGVPPLVLEADLEWPGGRLSGGAPDTFEYGGRTWAFHTEHGAHALWGAYDNLRAVLDRFLDITLRESEGEEWINRWGNEVRYVEAGSVVRNSKLPAPFHYLQLLFNPAFWNTISPWDFLALPGLLVSIFLTLSVDPIRERVALDGLLMKDYFKLWTPNLRATFVGLGHSLLAAPSEEITLAGFIGAIRFYTMLRRDSWRLSYLPANANDCLIRPMIRKIEDMDGWVMTGARADSLQRRDGGWQVLVEDTQRGGMRTVRAEHVIVATDPGAAQAIFCNSPDTAEVAGGLCFPPVIRSATARLWFDACPRDGAPGGMFTGDFAIDNFFWLHRLHDEFFEWREATGGSAIEVHFYAPDRVLDQSDEVLLITAIKEVQRAFPSLKGHYVHGAIRRNGRTQTRFLIPTAHSLHVQTPWPGILACGDWIGYPSPAYWMERSCVTGMAAANAVLRAYAALGRAAAEPWDIIPPRRPEALARGIGAGLYALRKLFGPPILGGARLARRLFGGRARSGNVGA